MTIINREHRFIYLKSQKSAGTSVEAHLLLHTPLGGDIWHTAADIKKHGLPLQGPRMVLGVRGDKLSTIDPPAWLAELWPWRWSVHINEHHEAAPLSKALGGFWEGAVKATNVRNPWDLMVSAWQWRRDGKGGNAAPITAEFGEWVDAAVSGDAAWRSRVSAYDPRELLDAYVFVNGQCVVDVLIRQESINDGLAEIGHRLGLPLGTIGLREKQSKRLLDYRGYYSDGLADKVGAYFADIIALTGYRFE